MLWTKLLPLSLMLAVFGTHGIGWCADQPQPGAGNATAVAIASKSPMVNSAFAFLNAQAGKIGDAHAHAATLDAIANRDTCIAHRAGLDGNAKAAIVRQLLAAGLLDNADGGNFPGGLLAGVFPPVPDDGSKCPHLPQPFDAAPGSSFGSHHSYPGGLAVHEAFNETTAISLARDYRIFYGHRDKPGLPTVDAAFDAKHSDISIDEDVIIAAPIWHDWAKTIVYQWNLDGTEFQELPIGGNGATDDNGAAGNSKTGAHHILGLAEAMARAMPPRFVIAEACAHSAPVLGAEYKVVNWLRAAAIIARVDLVARGYLRIDADKKLRLAEMRGNSRVADDPKQASMMVEDTIHNLSDANFNLALPAIAKVNSGLRALAPKFGYSPNDAATYNNSFRNPVMSYLTAERLFIVMTNDGMPGLEREVRKLVGAGLLHAAGVGK